MLHVVVGNQFRYNAAFEYDKPQSLPGGQSRISSEELHDYKDLIMGIQKAESMNAKLAFEWNSLQVTIQVVQGILFRVKVDAHSKSCSASTNCDVKRCSFKIWSRTWLPPNERLIIKDFSCTDI